MAERLIDMHVVQDAANLFNVADALGEEYVSCYQSARKYDDRVKALFETHGKKPFYVDAYSNRGVKIATEFIHMAVEIGWTKADEKGFVPKGVLCAALQNYDDILKKLDEDDAFVFERMVKAFCFRMYGEYQDCHGDSQYEWRLLQYERNWIEFGDHNYKYHKFVKYDDEEDEDDGETD